MQGWKDVREMSLPAHGWTHAVVAHSLYSIFLRMYVDTRADEVYKSVFLSSYAHIGVVQGRTLMCLALYVCTSACTCTNAQMVSAITLPSLPPAPKPTYPSVSTARITQVVVPRCWLQSQSQEAKENHTPKKHTPWRHLKERGRQRSHPCNLNKKQTSKTTKITHTTHTHTHAHTHTLNPLPTKQQQQNNKTTNQPPPHTHTKTTPHPHILRNV